MKAAVIYYSLEGSTELIAQMISEEIGAKLFKLEPEKSYPTKGFMKFFWGGKSVMFHQKPKLINELIDTDSFDTLIIGSPIWAGTFAPPIHSFLSMSEIKNKTIYLFACHGGGGASKYFAKMKEALMGNVIAGTVDFQDPIKQDKKEVNKKVKQFCKANF